MKPRAVSKKTLIVAIPAILVILFALGLRPSPVVVDVALVERGPLRVTLDDEGVTRVRERYAVSAPVAARVLRVELEPGTPVRVGVTVVATLSPLDPALLDARSREGGEARVLAARAAVGRARADRGRAAAETAFAESEQRRSVALAREGLLSTQAVEAAALLAATRAASLEAGDYAVATAEAELAAAQAVLLDVSSLAPERWSGGVLALTAPVDGVVLRRFHESEAVVPAGEPLLEIGDPAALEVVADLLSRDAARVAPGQQVEIVEWGGTAALAGRVERIEPAGRTKISALGVEEQRVDVVIRLEGSGADAPATLGDGFRVEVRIVLWESVDELLVPTSAIFRPAGSRATDPGAGTDASGASGQRWAAFVLADDRLARRELEIGAQDGLVAQVISGLTLGETVVVHPGSDVAEGVAARPRDAS